MSTEEKLIELVGLWYQIIGPLHHKDRDCHFYIERKFSYDAKGRYAPKWSVVHDGYLLGGSCSPEFEHERDAQLWLIDKLVAAIRGYADHEDRENTAPSVNETEKRIEEILA